MLDDFRFAIRRLRHSPGFTSIAVITLALGIGANTAIFSIADAVLFRPLPYDDPDRVHILQWMDRRTGARATRIEYSYLKAISEHHGGLSEVALLEDAPSQIVVGGDGAESVSVMAVTPNYFQLLGARAARGRLLDPRDESSVGRVAVLPYSVWRQRFGGDEGIIGRPLVLGNATFDVVGVLPSHFIFPSLRANRTAIVTVMPSLARQAEGGTFHPVVRREVGVTREQAQAELDALMMPLIPEKPNSTYLPVLEDVRSVLYPTGRPIMIFLLSAAALVLVIGCANLASMLLTRTHQREKETGIRMALGASRLRLVRMLMFEALIVGVAGGVAAAVVTSVTFVSLLRQVPPMAYRGAPVGVNLRLVVFAIGLGLLGGLLFAAVPAWRSGKFDVQHLLQGRRGLGSGHSRVGWPLVAVQVALAVTLVFGAVVASRAFLAVLNVPLGFSPESVLTLRAWPRGAKGLELQNFYTRALEQVSRRRDVVGAGAIGSMPFDGAAADEGVFVAGAREPLAGISHVLPGYFETVGISLERGRLLTWDDVRSGADVAVLSNAAARVLFPNREALGEAVTNGRERQLTVVGVVSNVRKSLDRESSDPVYVIPHDSASVMTLVVRTRTRNEAALTEIKREVGALAPGTPVTAAWWTDSISAVSAYRNPRFQTLVLGSFASLALILTAVGVFGIVAFVVAMRTREMGIRMAIGATPASLVNLMLRQALTPVAIGLVAGLVATRWASQLAEAQLFKMETRDPATLAAAVATVLTAAVLAAYLPARRASRVDPVVVLRAE